MAELCNSILHRSICERLIGVVQGAEDRENSMTDCPWLREIHTVLFAEEVSAWMTRSEATSIEYRR